MWNHESSEIIRPYTKVESTLETKLSWPNPNEHLLSLCKGKGTALSVGIQQWQADASPCPTAVHTWPGKDLLPQRRCFYTQELE